MDSPQEKLPTYGSSLHYYGNNGDMYLNWQNQKVSINGQINARKFTRFDYVESTLLDFGAGAGNILSMLNTKREIAIEINPHAKKELHEKGFEVFLSVEEVDSNSVDFVISNHALEYVPFPILALKEIKRILKPGGILELCLPFNGLRKNRVFDRNDINRHLHTWNPQHIGNSLMEAGWNPQNINVTILRKSWFPGYHLVYRFPGFGLACFVYSWLRGRKQIFVIAKNRFYQKERRCR